MILVRVLAVVRENKIRQDRLFQIFKNRFHFGTRKRHESIGKRFEQRSLQLIRTDEQRSPTSRLRLSRPYHTENHPVKHAPWILLGQPQNSPTTTNRDVVGVGAQTEDC